MIPNRWQTIKELFHAALQRAPEERADFLDDACGNDETVRSEVASLLAAHAGDESFLAVPAFEMGAELLLDSSAGPSAGDQIGPYKILSELGSGGMGDVFLAQDTRLGRNIALKLLPEEVARDLQRVRRFEQEARTASALNHPNVCVIHEIGQTSDGRQFIAMEYIDGITLRARLAQQRMTLTETLDVGAQVAWALEAAHAAGVVHRDIKPENIMLRRDGYVKVVDFGIAKLNENLSPTPGLNEASTLGKVNTDPGTRLGTVKYMSPEQLRERPVDERTDIWSLGVVLHEMATGTTPFAARTTNETIAAILDRQPIDIAANAGEIPVGFRRIIEKALSKKRRERYQKVTSLAADLRQVWRQIDDPASGKLPAALMASGNKDLDISAPPFDISPAPAQPEKRSTLISTTAESILTEIKHHKKAAMLVAVAGLFALLYATPSLVRQASRWRASSLPDQASIASWQKFTTQSASSTGQSVCAAISPDGTTVVYAEEKDGKQTLINTSLLNYERTDILPAAAIVYRGVTFSPDGAYVYVVHSDSSETPILSQIAWPHGTARKIKEGVDSPIAFSPDGKRFTFVRIDRAQGEYFLVIADVNGGHEEIVSTRRDGNTFSKYGPAWSPDGQAIVCGAGYWDRGYHEALLEFNVTDHAERTLGNHHWYSILQIAWRHDGGGLIVSAADRAVRPYQLWRVSYPEGAAANITNETTDYKSVSLPNNDNQIVSISSKRISRIWVNSKNGEAKEIASTVGFAFGLAWTKEGRIVFSSMGVDALDISIVDQDGSNQQRLTADAADNYTPATSPDGRFIVFASTRGDSSNRSFNIWRMNAADGSDPLQLTFTDGNSYPSCSPDGEWVFYDNQSSRTPTVWKVPLAGGPPVQLSDQYARMPVVSPDGKSVACRYIFEGAKREIAIVPISGGVPRRVPIEIRDWQSVQWTRDSRALTYIDWEHGKANIWSYDLATGARHQLTNFDDKLIFAYGWSADQKLLVSERGTESRDVTVMKNQQ